MRKRKEGLKGNPGLQVRYQMPNTMESALKIATTATQAEKEREREDSNEDIWS